MTERLHIVGGHNGFDPLGEVFGQIEMRETQIPAVQRRCATVLKSAIDLVDDFQDGVSLYRSDVYLSPAIKFEIPPFGPRRNSVSGNIALRATYKRITDGELEGFPDTQGARAELLFQSPHQEFPDTPFLEIWSKTLWVHTQFGKRAGTHAHLNYFGQKVAQIKKKAFPPTKQ